MAMKALVLGGAGYIGSHTAARLCAGGHEVCVADSLATGHIEAVPSGARFFKGDIRDAAFMDEVCSEEAYDVVIHFAASSLVGESVSDPLLYYDNNVWGSVCVAQAMRRHRLGRIIFSSTAAVYGEPESVPICESAQTRPTNPYGETKLAIERMLSWAGRAYGMRSVCLRYFNAAGAAAGGIIGEDHSPESHLIPLILKAALGQRGSIAVYGRDYPTADGTCIRDYVHVDDIADAHIRAAEYLVAGGASDVFNLGTGKGCSVREAIDAARAVTGARIAETDAPRREGDPAVLVASGERARAVLGWAPRPGGIERIIASAWDWHRTHPEGYGE